MSEKPPLTKQMPLPAQRKLSSEDRFSLTSGKTIDKYALANSDDIDEKDLKDYPPLPKGGKRRKSSKKRSKKSKKRSKKRSTKKRSKKRSTKK